MSRTGGNEGMATSVQAGLVEDDEPFLAVEGLSCAAGYRLLFEHVGFELHPGQWLRLTGPNGSGKTTLLRAIAGLVRPVSGQVLWQGRAREAASEVWRSHVLYQGHLAGWKDGFGALENLRAQRLLDDGLRGPRDGEPSQLEGLLERCGLAGRGALPYARLSAGQRRRLSLARLAGSVHALWLLDEPGTALDAQGQVLLGQVLREHLLRGGCAIVATHLPVDCGRTPIELDLGAHAGTAPVGSID